jgi:hypothetical protein
MFDLARRNRGAWPDAIVTFAVPAEPLASRSFISEERG